MMYNESAASFVHIEMTIQYILITTMRKLNLTRELLEIVAFNFLVR